MAEQLIITLDSLHADTAGWLVLDARGNRIGFPQRGRLADVAALTAQRRIVVLVPGDEMPLLSAIVPGRNRQQIARAAPFAIEDRVAGDVEDLFVAVLKTGNTSTASRFVVTEHTLLQAWLEKLQLAGITPDVLLPDHAALPAAEEDEAHWWLTGDRLLASDPDEGFAAPATDIDILLRHLPDDCRLHLARVGDAPVPAALEERIKDSDETITEIDADKAFTELAAAAASRKDGGLLQQRYQPEGKSRGELARWRAAAVLAGVLLILGSIHWGLDVYKLQREAAFLDQQMERLFKRAMPGASFDPATAAAQLRIRLRGSDGESGGKLLRRLGAVGNALDGLDDTRLTGFSYRNNRLEISVSVKSAQTLESLQEALRNRTTASVKLQSANSEGGRLEGRIVIEGDAA